MTLRQRHLKQIVIRVKTGQKGIKRLRRKTTKWWGMRKTSWSHVLVVGVVRTYFRSVIFFQTALDSMTLLYMLDETPCGVNCFFATGGNNIPEFTESLFEAEGHNS